MAAVTQRISNYLSGVSKQPDSEKLPGQVRECINGLADPTLGMTKRPGFKFISKLKTTGGSDFTGTQLDDAKWFYINRSTERYVGCITPKIGNTNGTIHVWNADTGVACTVTFPNNSAAYITGVKTNYDVVSVQATTIITNNLIEVTTQPVPTFVAKSRGTLLISTLPEGESSIQSQPFEIKLGGTSIGSTITISHTSGASDTYETILTALETKINAESITGLTVTKHNTSLQLDYVTSVGGTPTRTAFTLEAKGGADNERLVTFQDWASNSSWLPVNSFHGHIVTIINSVTTDIDNYYARFVADNQAAGSGYWRESIAPDVSPGLTATTMPHRLRNSGVNTFVFEVLPWEDRVAGDDITNKHPSFVGKTIKKAFYHDNRLGFLSEDNMILSQAKDPYNFYGNSARTITASDPIDVNCASLRPTQLFAILPARQGLALFSKAQQFLAYADDGPLTPLSTKVRPISNMEMSDDVYPIDVGTHMNFISKTPNFVRVFGMTTRGLEENPDIVDIGRTVNEWITIDVDTLVASIQNEFICMASQASDEVFFYKTHKENNSLAMESWFKWKLPGTIQQMVVDQDDMYMVTKQGNQYVLSDANLTQSPEAAIITNAQGQKINPCIDFYTPASNGLTGNNLKTVVYDAANLRSKCYIPFANLTTRKNIVLVAGTTAAGTYNNSGYTVTAEVGTDSDGTFFIVDGLDLSDNAANVYVGYAYDFDLTLPQIYFSQDQDGKQKDYTASLTIARLKFDTGLSGLLSFKLNTVGRFAGTKTHTLFETNNVAANGDPIYTDYSWLESDLSYIDQNQVKVKINNKEVADTLITFQSDRTIRLDNSLLKQNLLSGDGSNKVFRYTFTIDTTKSVKVKVGGVETTDFIFSGGNDVENFITFNTAPPSGTNNVHIYNVDPVTIYLDEWYELAPSQMANEYLADDVPLDESRVVTLPIHQRSKNFSLRVFNDSPFPVSLNSMMWEGNYSPRFYRRT